MALSQWQQKVSPPRPYVTAWPKLCIQWLTRGGTARRAFGAQKTVFLEQLTRVKKYHVQVAQEQSSIKKTCFRGQNMSWVNAHVKLSVTHF